MLCARHYSEHFIFTSVVHLHLSILSLTFKKDPNNKQPDVAELTKFIQYSLKIFFVLSIDTLFKFASLGNGVRESCTSDLFYPCSHIKYPQVVEHSSLIKGKERYFCKVRKKLRLPIVQDQLFFRKIDCSGFLSLTPFANFLITLSACRSSIVPLFDFLAFQASLLKYYTVLRKHRCQKGVWCKNSGRNLIKYQRKLMKRALTHLQNPFSIFSAY